MRYLRLLSPLLTSATLVWCLLVGWWIWTTPVRYVGLMSHPENPDQMVQAEKYEPFASVSALGAIPLVIPVVLTGLATVAAWARQAMLVLFFALVLTAYALVTGFSIGGGYMPAAGVLLLASCLALVFDHGFERLSRG